MPRVDPQEFERRAQRLRKAEEDWHGAEDAIRAAKEQLAAAEREWQGAAEDLEKYVREAGGLEYPLNQYFPPQLGRRTTS